MAVTRVVFLAGLAAALPQGGSIPPSPTGAECSFHVDHWDCAAPCTTRTSTQLQVAATITNLPEFMDSMNARYSTSGVSFSGTTVVVHTSLYTFPGGSFTGYGVYDSNALRSAGYSVVTSLSVFTTCPTSTPTLPPSPTGSLCSPHGDHWHCEPTSSPSAPPGVTTTSPGVVLPPSPTGSACSPHGDHWHCEPTTPPAVTVTPTRGGGDDTITSSATAPEASCSAHDDHWHCPPGVEEPSTPPGTVPTPTDDGHDDDNYPGTPTGSAPEASCSAHDDHWHCPPGVEEPSTPPGSAPTPPGDAETGPAPSQECEAHDDHWHCPDGVSPPSTPPGGAPEPAPTPTGTHDDDDHDHDHDGDEEACVPHDDHWHCPEGVSPPSTPPGAHSTPPGPGSPDRPTSAPSSGAGAGDDESPKRSTLTSSRSPTRTSPAVVVTAGAAKIADVGSYALGSLVLPLFVGLL